MDLDDLTTRDWLAALTMYGIVARPAREPCTPGRIAETAYAVADAMLAWRHLSLARRPPVVSDPDAAHTPGGLPDLAGQEGD